MRDMNEDERKVYSEKMDYIAKLKDSMDQSEMDSLLPREIQVRLDAPRFHFGGDCLYPRKDFNDYLEASFTGSPIAEKLRRMEAELTELKDQLGHSKEEADAYVADIERLEGELKEAKASRYAPRDNDDQDGGVQLTKLHPKEGAFHKHEMLAFEFSMLCQWMQNHRPQTPAANVRVYQLAKEMRDAMTESFDVKEMEAQAKAFRTLLERAVEECFQSSPTNIRPLLAMGFTDRTRKNSAHWKIAFKDMDDYTFTLSKTPSDSRAVEKCKEDIVRRLCI